MSTSRGVKRRATADLPLPPKVRVRRHDDIQDLDDKLSDLVHQQLRTVQLSGAQKKKIRLALFGFQEEVVDMIKMFTKVDGSLRPEPEMEQPDSTLAEKVKSTAAQVKSLAAKVAEGRAQMPKLIQTEFDTVAKENADKLMSAASAVGSSFEAHDTEDAGAGGVEDAKLQELENVADDVTGSLKDTTSVLSKRLDEGKVTLSALQAQKKKAPAAFEEVMASK